MIMQKNYIQNFLKEKKPKKKGKDFKHPWGAVQPKGIQRS